MTTTAVWVNGVEAQDKGSFVAVRLDLMVSHGQMDAIKQLLFNGQENTQHEIWLSNINPKPLGTATAPIAPAFAAVPDSLPKGWGVW